MSDFSFDLNMFELFLLVVCLVFFRLPNNYHQFGTPYWKERAVSPIYRNSFKKFYKNTAENTYATNTDDT